MQAPKRILRKPEVLTISGMTESALDRDVRAGLFPKPVKLSDDPKARAIGWRSEEIEAWIDSRRPVGEAA